MMNIRQAAVSAMEQAKREKYSKWIGEEYHGLWGGPEMAEGTVLHESEFLKKVVECVASSELLTGEYLLGVDTDFLAIATGIEQRVFDVLAERGDVEAIRSIIKATVGILDFSRKALEYYGISRFATGSGTPSDMHDLGDGYYYCNWA